MKKKEDQKPMSIEEKLLEVTASEIFFLQLIHDAILFFNFSNMAVEGQTVFHKRSCLIMFLRRQDC